MVVVSKFTPERFISAPRRGAAVPNENGTLALFTQTTHTIGQRKSLKEIRVLNIASGESELLVDDDKIHDACWLGDGTNHVVYLKTGSGGVTLVMIADAENPWDVYIADDIQAPVDNLKVKRLNNGSIAFAVVGLADEKGQLYNQDSKANKQLHTARVCDEYGVRIWNTYTRPQKYAIWYSTLVKEDGKWRLNTPLKNAVAGTDLEVPLGMYEPGTPTDQFDISDAGLIIAAEEPHNNDPTMTGTSNVYLVALDSFDSIRTEGPKKIAIQSDSDKGFCSHPRFSPSGSMVAFLRAPYGHSANLSIFIKFLDRPEAVHVFDMVTGVDWDLIPNGFEFSLDGHSLHVTADDCGRVALYRLTLQPNAHPKPLLRNGSVYAHYPFQLDDDSSESLLVTSSSLVEPSVYQIIDTDLKAQGAPWLVSKASQTFSLGLSPKQVSEIYFEGAGDYCVHAWVIKPRGYDPGKRYPLCLLIHGGPVGAWADAWNTRWNPALWAAQGYVVVCPNITGSTGFGLDYAEAVNDNWGGRPYDDLVKCLDYIKEMPGIDMDNAVAAGASYGGYMMNWIQGQELGRRFKALVCHDGIFHVPSFVLQTDLCENDSEFGGPPYLWSNVDGLERYNPARPDLLKNWKTPMLIIHSEKDYRCPVTDGIAAFHTLKALGTPACFVNFPDEGHWVMKEENSLEWHRLVFEWINRWSGVGARERELVSR